MEDIKLKRSCIIISIVAFTILVIAVILKFSVFPNLPNKANETGSFTAYIILEILIWVSSGIGASAITLVLSKKYDYEKKIAITDYYYDSQTLLFEIVKLKPLANDNWIEATKSFEFFQSSYAVWKKMLHNRESMRFIHSCLILFSSLYQMYCKPTKKIRSILEFHVTNAII